MSETRSRRPSTRRNGARAEPVETEGMIGRIVDNACDNPAMTGGLFVMALTASAIVSNAMFLQSVRHPEPLFSTRPPLVVERHAPNIPAPLPPRRDDQAVSIAPPLPRPAPTAIVAMTQPVDEFPVRDIQAELARKGLYLGAIDGEYGPLSQSAITAYQKAAGLPVTGEPSAALLEHLQTTASAAPVQSAPPDAVPVDTPALPRVDATVATSEQLRYERVQAALNRIGYGPVVVDGTANTETTNAIRRFELDNGLPISGAAADSVIDRLIAIGALPAT